MFVVRAYVYFVFACHGSQKPECANLISGCFVSLLRIFLVVVSARVAGSLRLGPVLVRVGAPGTAVPALVGVAAPVPLACAFLRSVPAVLAFPAAPALPRAVFSMSVAAVPGVAVAILAARALPAPALLAAISAI